MKRHRLALKPILLIDFVLVFVFAIVLLFIYFPPRCFYPNVDFAVNFLGKTRNDVWEVTMAMEKCMDGGAGIDCRGLQRSVRIVYENVSKV